jgi:hypothetical protein
VPGQSERNPLECRRSDLDRKAPVALIISRISARNDMAAGRNAVQLYTSVMVVLAYRYTYIKRLLKNKIYALIYRYRNRFITNLK